MCQRIGDTHFKVITDHRALVWLFGQTTTTKQTILIRWALRLQQFDFEVIYRKGTENQANDSLSRYPQKSTKYDLKEPIEPLYTVENLDETEEEEMHELLSCPVCTSSLGAHAPSQMKITSLSEHLTGRRHKHSLRVAVKRAFNKRSAETIYHIDGINTGVTYKKPDSPGVVSPKSTHPTIHADEASFLMLTSLSFEKAPITDTTAHLDQCLKVFLSDLEQRGDDDNCFSFGLCSPTKPEIYELVFQLSPEELVGADMDDESKEADASALSVPILDPQILSAAQIEIGTAQRADPDLAPLIEYAHTQINPFKTKARKEAFHSLARHYSLRDGVLYRSVGTQHDKFRCECIVVPSSLRRKLLTYFHEDVNGHLGFRKLINKLRSRFFWENMQRDIRNFSRACLFCRSRKSVPDSKAGLPQRLPETTKFGSIMAYDIVGPFNETISKNKYVLTMMDMYSRYVEAVPLTAATSEEVARGLFHGWISRHGCPETILSDQGTHFTSKMMRRLHGILGIDKLTSAAYHPQTNGRLERFHRSFSPMLLSLLKDEKRHKYWDQYVQHVVFVINTTQAEAHERTPFEVARGFVPTLPSDVLWGTANAVLNFSADFHVNLPLTMRVTRQEVIEFQKRYDEDRFKREFRKHHPVELKIGDLVMLHRPPITLHDDDGRKMEGIPTKFLLRWSGPHEVIANPHPNVYTIGLEKDAMNLNWSKQLL